MNIYVISLSDSKRRPVIERRLSGLGLTFSFIDAVDKKDISCSRACTFYDEDACMSRHGRVLVPAELACFMSHIKAWHAVLKSKTHAIILEDDAMFESHFVDVVNLLDSVSFDFDVMLLGHSKLHKRLEGRHYFNNPFYKKKRYRNIDIGTVFKLWTSGMVGYFVTCEAASKLVGANKTIRCVSDDWDYHFSKGLSVVEVRPYSVWEDFVNLSSTIEGERKKLSKNKKDFSYNLLKPLRFVRAIYRNIVSKYLHNMSRLRDHPSK